MRNRPDASDGTPSILVIEEVIKYFLTRLNDPLSGKTYTPSQGWAFSRDARTLVLLVFDQLDAKNHDSALLLWDIEARKPVGPSFAMYNNLLSMMGPIFTSELPSAQMERCWL